MTVQKTMAFGLDFAKIKSLTYQFRADRLIFALLCITDR
jgi:hypothetical protein